MILLIMQLILGGAFSWSRDLAVLDQNATYEVSMVANGAPPVKFQKPCTQKFIPIGNGSLCTFPGGSPGISLMMGGKCTEWEKIYTERCLVKVFDADATRAMVDQNLKGGVDSLTAAVKDSYKQIMTSEEFRRVVREEVRRALAEQTAGN